MRYATTLMATAAVILLPFVLLGQDTKANKTTTKAPEDNAKLILEDSFEKGQAFPDGWQSGAAVPGVRYVYDKKMGTKSKRSLSLQKSAQRYFPIAQWFRTIPAPKTSAIDVRAMVRAKNATKAIMEVQFLDGGGRMVSKKWVGYIGAKNAGDKPASHTWKSYGDVAEIPPGTQQLRIAFQIYGPGKVWFDNLRITEVAASTVPVETKLATGATLVKVNGADGQYIYKPARKAGSKPLGLLIVLPGGDGSADFHPFVSRVHENSAADDVVLAQPVAKKWSAEQRIVWPTRGNKIPRMKYTTEEFIAAVVEDVKKKHKLDPKRISVLAWSSSGPAAYAAMLGEKSVVSGGLIAMSVFKPDQLPTLTSAKGRKFYLLHSPQDRTCPHWMAKQAKDKLTSNGGHVTLVDYSGGHGWHGDVFGNIRKGLLWLEQTK